MYLFFLIMIFAKKEYITGMVRAVGTSVFPNIVISADDRDYYFDKKILKNMQNIKVR